MCKKHVILLFCLLLIGLQTKAQYNINTYVGSGLHDAGDGGPATAAELYQPTSVAVDGAGNLYFADYDNIVRKVNASGAISTIAGNGIRGYIGDGGPATAAQLSTPQGVAVDGSGNVYIADQANNKIRKVNTSGIISTIAGDGVLGHSGDGSPATAAELNAPQGVAVDGSGNVYIADMGNNVIRKVNTTGIISTFAGIWGDSGDGGDGGPAVSAGLGYPAGVAVDGSGNVYIADFVNNKIRKVNTSGIISTIAGNGITGYSGDGGSATVAELYTPQGVAVDGSGNVYIADQANNKIRKVNTSGIISTIAGNGITGYSGDGTSATAAELNASHGVAVDGSGNVYIADYGNNRIRKVNTSSIISTIAGNGTYSHSGDGGPATVAELNTPNYVALDGAGNVYIADLANNKIRKVNTSGIISTIAGNGITGYSGDGGPATGAELNTPHGVAVDGSGNVYIADYNNNVIRKVNTSGIISTFAGNGVSGVTIFGGPATATELSLPQGIAVDGSGNVYIAEGRFICKVNTSGIISKFAGGASGFFSGDGGPATAAGLWVPTGVAVDESGNVYIADYYNIRVRKVNTSGIINTIAGNGGTGYSGDGGPATSAALGGPGGYPVDGPYGIAVDGSGNVYIADHGDNRIRKVNTSGIISTIAGNGIGGYSGDGGPATTAELNNVTGVAVDGALNLYVSDNGNNRIRKLVASSTATVSPIMGGSFVCVSSLLTLSDTTSDGAWSSSNVSVATVSSGGIVSGISSGTVIITYAVIGGLATKPITVNPLPSAGTITGTSSVCVSSTIPLTDATTSGIWSSSLTGIATVGSTGIVNGVSGGTTTISYSVTNVCGTAVATKFVTVNPLPAAGIITGTSSVCVSSTITLTDTTTGGIWSSSNSTATILAGLVSGVSAGIDTISYSVTNTCGIASATKIITINPLPTAGTITSSSSVCVSSTITLTDAISGGVWSSSNSAATVLGGVVSGVSAGTDTISYSVTNTCGIATATVVITINPLPDAGTIISSDSVCVGDSITLSNTSSGGSWSTVFGNATIISGLLTGVTMGVDTIVYTASNTCGTTSTKKIIEIIDCVSEVKSILAPSQDITLYPNPTQNNITLSSLLPINTVVVSNLLGQKVFTGVYNDNKVVINLGQLPEGIYLLKINNAYVYKVIKQ